MRKDGVWPTFILSFGQMRIQSPNEKECQYSTEKSLLRLLESFLIFPAFGLLCLPTNVCFVFFFFKGLLTGSLALISIYIHKITSFFKEIFMCNGRLNAGVGVFWAVLIIAILCPGRIQTYNAGFVFWWNQNKPEAWAHPSFQVYPETCNSCWPDSSDCAFKYAMTHALGSSSTPRTLSPLFRITYIYSPVR